MNLARLLAEFSQFPKITRENIGDRVVLEGFENFSKAKEAGKGVIFITGHFGAWELISFASAIFGYPLMFVMRPIDNPRVDRLIMGYRLGSGNQGVEKKRRHGERRTNTAPKWNHGHSGRSECIQGRRRFREFFWDSSFHD
jgi:lauroyl/myristoyl acyltransferase